MKSYEQFKEDLENLDEIFGLFDAQSRRERRGRKQLAKQRFDTIIKNRTGNREDPEEQERKHKLEYMERRDKREQEEKKKKGGYSVETEPPMMDVHYLNKRNELRKTRTRYPHSKKVKFAGER
jgi:hypothetical protein